MYPVTLSFDKDHLAIVFEGLYELKAGRSHPTITHLEIQLQRLAAQENARVQAERGAPPPDKPGANGKGKAESEAPP